MTGPYWQRVTVQQPTVALTPAHDDVPTWAAVSGMTDVEARVMASVSEDATVEMTVTEDAYEIHLRGAWPQVRPEMRVLDGANAYDIRRVVPPPPFGEPATIVHAVRVRP